MKKIPLRLPFVICMIIFTSTLLAQTIQIGKASYSTVLPSGCVGPQYVSGASAVPKVSADFKGIPQTNDFWSSLIFPFYGDNFSNVMYAHPLTCKANASGLAIGYTTVPVFAGQDYLFPFNQQLNIGVTGLNASKAVTDDYGDWTVKALWNDGTRTMRATIGHGLPFVFCTISGGTAEITSSSSPTIWYNQKGVLGISVNGVHYGIFAPDSSTWSGTTTLRSSLNGKNYFSVALLPDNSAATLEIYRLHAYAFVTGSTVSWNYNESTAKLNSVFTYTTDLKESKNGNVNQTLTALYRHQWINTSASLTSFEYTTVAGKMKVFDGNQFSTEAAFEGVLPALPDQGDYDKPKLKSMLDAMMSETLPETGSMAGSYRNGKLIARFAHVVNIADQIGDTVARNYFISQIKIRLESWFSNGGAQSFVYNAKWKTLTGYPAEFGTDTQINDHNFHVGYMIMGAAIVAQYDSAWAAQNNWGGMVNMIIKDANNWDRSDTSFPFLRHLDAYAGHSWAAGHGDFGDGNNQESSSEAMNFATAVILWGSATHQKAVRDLGIYLYITEMSAIEQYWFNIDKSVFPASYSYSAVGMVWGGKGVHSTWFGSNPDYIHGINMLPFNAGSMYLGRHVDYVGKNYLEVINELNGAAPTWKDILWQYESFVDPGAALSNFLTDSTYTPEEGESKAHTYHWLCNLKKMGTVDITVTADIPTYAVFKNGSGYKTYCAYNPYSGDTTIHFSDGYAMQVPAGKLKSVNTYAGNPNAPTVILTADKNTGSTPLKVKFSGSQSYDKNASSLIFAWNFGDGTFAATADTFHVFTNPGMYKVVLTVTNAQQISVSDSVTITVLGHGTPYSGTPVSIPGVIQAENYDKGGEGVAYHDVDTNNIGLQYRVSEGVDIELSGTQGYDVYWMVSGEWLEYTFQTADAGYYDIKPLVATVPGFGNFHIIIDNVDVSGKQAVKNTGGWQSWSSMTIPNVRIEAGKHILRFEVGTDTQSEIKNWLFSLNSIAITASSSAGVTDNSISNIHYGLSQNYPNPFNPSTSITYTLPERVAVTISIYNQLGQKVATLFNGTKEAGQHSVVWNAGNMASGVYFCELRSDKFNAVKKLTLIK